MSRHLLFGASAIALAALGTIASPVQAQVAAPELVIEGPIDAIGANSITVMGIQIDVPNGTMDTPTRTKVPLTEAITADLPGRSKKFLGGTAIVTGGSIGGKVTATEVFSDVNENVIVGEVTSSSPLTVNFLPVIKGTSVVMPANKPTNVFGFEIDENTVVPGSLISIEGYLGEDNRLYYHNLEADTGTPKNGLKNEVSVARSQCRDRAGTGKDELEVRGAVHRANMLNLTAPVSPVTITYFRSATATTSVTATPVIDPANPQYAEYRYTSSNRTLGGCPQPIKVTWKSTATDTDVATVDLEAAP